jgi:hypothetical protein
VSQGGCDAMAVVWVIWRVRNGFIFAPKSHDVQEAVEKIKRRMSWDWLLAKKSRSPCLYYEWCTNPLYLYIVIVKYFGDLYFWLGSSCGIWD